MERDPMIGESRTMPQATVAVVPKALKGEQPTITPEEVEAQGHIAVRVIEEVDYDTVRGTCGDERERIGLLNGEPTVETRPSAYGGPNIYALYMAQLSGFFGPNDTSTAEERLGT